MQALRSFNRLCQVSSSRQALKTLQFSRPPSPLTATRQLLQRRGQHDDNGPHKEYFQKPGKEPKPDLTPYIRESAQQSQHSSQSPSSSSSLRIPSTAAQNTLAGQQLITLRPRGWQAIPRVVRSLIWFILFFEIGAVVAAVLITYEYLAPPYPSGSPEEQQLINSILDNLEVHPLVQILREGGWVEVDPSPPDLQDGHNGRNMVHQVLGGNTQGIIMKEFHSPSMNITVLVFFIGYGVEGWPDVVHGGLISSVLHEGYSKHVAYHYPGHVITPERVAKTDFLRPCRPGDYYSLLVLPSGQETLSHGNMQFIRVKMTSFLVQLEDTPPARVEYDPKVRSELNKKTSFLNTSRDRSTFVVSQAKVNLLPKRFIHSTSHEHASEEGEDFVGASDFSRRPPGFQQRPNSSQEERKDAK